MKKEEKEINRDERKENLKKYFELFEKDLLGIEINMDKG